MIELDDELAKEYLGRAASTWLPWRRAFFQSKRAERRSMRS